MLGVALGATPPPLAQRRALLDSRGSSQSRHLRCCSTPEQQVPWRHAPAPSRCSPAFFSGPLRPTRCGVARSTSRASNKTVIALGSDESDILALDVEYLHLAPARAVRHGRVTILPAEVCLMAQSGAIVLHEFCHPGQEALQNACFAGGVPEALWGTAPPLREVLARVRAAVAGHRLVGHGLAKDLTALGIQHPRRAGILTLVLVCTRVNHDNADGPAKDLLAPDIQHPRHLTVDTVGCAAFQGPGGQARSLAALAARLLGRTIQADRHSAREDAQAVLELYQRVAARDTSTMDAAALEAHYLAELLAREGSRQG